MKKKGKEKKVEKFRKDCQKPKKLIIEGINPN